METNNLNLTNSENVMVSKRAIETIEKWKTEGNDIDCATLDEAIGGIIESSYTYEPEDEQRLFNLIRNLHYIKNRISSFKTESHE